MGRILATLEKRLAPLSAADAQLDRLQQVALPISFEGSLATAGLFPLRATGVEILQINVGRRCNQTCRHCHVDAGPDRKEVMSREVLEACLAFLTRHGVRTFDITGGAPELHPDFREIVARGAASGAHVMHRCNLTAILLPNYSDIPALLARHRVEVIASLPYFQSNETDAQRGEGVFEESIEALQLLNSLGYGRGDGLQLNLVANPVGTFLPGNQGALEARWKKEMMRRYGIAFDRLYTITNMPISRFLEFLDERGKVEEYLSTLANAFNPSAAAGVMCRGTLSVSYDGALHDCDFNQMLEMPLAGGAPRTIFDALDPAGLAALASREIATAPHCFGCTAGAGSSCGGAVA